MALTRYAYTFQSGPSSFGNFRLNPLNRALYSETLASSYCRIFPMVFEGQPHAERVTANIAAVVPSNDGNLGQTGYLYRHRGVSNCSQLDAISVDGAGTLHTFGISSSTLSNSSTRCVTGRIHADIYDADGNYYVLSTAGGPLGEFMYLLREDLVPIAWTNTGPEQSSNHTKYITPATPDPVTGYPRFWMLSTISATQYLAIYLCTITDPGNVATGENLDCTLVYSIANLTAANAIFDLTLNSASNVAAIIDEGTDQLILTASTGTTTEVRSLRLSLPGDALWTQTLTGIQYLPNNGHNRQYTDGKTIVFAGTQNSGSTDGAYLLDLLDGTILDSGDTGTNGISGVGIYWDQRYNCLMWHTDSAIYAGYFSANPHFVRPPIDQGRARWYLDDPRAAVRLRGDPVVDTVNGNMEVLTELLAVLADADGTDLLEVVIDLNGHSLVNIRSPVSPDDAKVA